MVKRVEPGPSRHRCKKQFHRAGTERPPSLTDWIPAGPKLVPGKLLWLPAGIYPPRAGLTERRTGSNQDCFLVFTMAMRRSLIASDDFAGRRLKANASCNA